MQGVVAWGDAYAPLSDIARSMRDSEGVAVPIGENDKLIGMVTDRDIVCRCFADGRDPTSMTARDVMTSGIVYCTENQSIEDAIHMMEEKQIRSMTVINGKKGMTGMLSLGDLAHSTKHELTGEHAKSGSAQH